VHILRRQIYYL